MKWISVKDGLPENTDIVLAYHKKEGTIFAWHDDCFQNKERYFNGNFITHWMLLPEPPTN